MNFRIIPVKPSLMHCVEMMFQIENKSENVIYRNFPTANLSMTFNYGADALEKTEDIVNYTPSLSIGGFQVNPIEYIPKGITGLIIVKLKPHAKALLKNLHGPIQIYGNWDLSDLYHQNSSVLLERLTEINNADKRVEIVENYLDQIFTNKDLNPYALEAIRLFDQHRGQVTVKQVAEKLGYSKKQFERFFIHTVGLTPKKYSRLIRFQQSMQLISQSNLNLTQVALNAGYFDQAHFNKEFKQFTGNTPEAYKALSTSLNKHALPSQAGNCKTNLTIGVQTL